MPAKAFRSHPAEYQAWVDMRRRCRVTNLDNSANYSLRGITVDPAWMSFETFFRDMGVRPSNRHSLDRIDNNSNYTPSNCRWATWEQQEGNRRTSIIIDTPDHGPLHLAEAARRYGLHKDTLRFRLARKWSVEKALRTPVRQLARAYSK